MKIVHPSSTGDTQISTAGAGGSEKILSLGICLCLALAVWLVFGRTTGYGFVNYDDNLYVYENAQVCQGLNVGGIEWAFSHSVDANWHPLTMLSCMLDYQFYGLKAGGYHLTNVLLHTAGVILLFLVLRNMTGAMWRSAFVAALFAIHPLRVESVAWVAERKDVLSGVFFMLTLGAYVWYVREPRRWSRYLAVLCFFALGLMSKPMLVTVPFVLLLLDYWPLYRLAAAQGPKMFNVPVRPVLEKIPLFAISAAGCLITLVTQDKIIGASPFSLRVSNACVSYATYLWQMVYPGNLAVFYPFREQGLSLRKVAMSFLLLALVSTLAFRWRRKHPWLLVGWLWYLGMLVPVIGFVPVGLQAHADRYTYLPQIGVYFIIAWAANNLAAGLRYGRLLLGILATAVITVSILCARIQVSYWKNNTTLWEHTLAVAGDSEIAHNNLGMDLAAKGQWDEAIAQYQQALRANPNRDYVHANLGIALAKKRQWDEAIAQFQQALKINPDFDMARIKLGNAFFHHGKVDDAIAQYQQALKINPDFDMAHNDLGIALYQKGLLDEAIAQFQQALNINPGYALGHVNLGNAFLQKGRLDDAIAQYQQALKTDPNLEQAHNGLGYAFLHKGQLDAAVAHYERALEINYRNAGECNHLAWRLATHPQALARNGVEAVELAQRLNQLSGGKDPTVLQTLAAADAETGQFPAAISNAQQAVALAGAQGNTALVNGLQKQIECYQAGLPYRDIRLTNVVALPHP